MVTVKTTGIEEVKKALSAFSLEIQDRVIPKAMDNEGTIVSEFVKDETPVSEKIHYQYYGGKKVAITPGNLKRSIARIPKIRGSKTNQIRLVGPRSGKKYKNDGWYGHMVDQGTVHSTASHFQEKGALQAGKVMGDVMNEAVEKAIRKLNR